MKIIHNKYIPFKGFVCINLFGVLFTRKKYLSKVTVNHERIHTQQQKGLLYLLFYVLYGLEWIVRLIIYRNAKTAYRNISFERDAYSNENNFEYNDMYGWIKRILK